MDVTIRNRPLLSHENGHLSTKISYTNTTVSIIQPNSLSDLELSKESQKTFQFKKVFGKETTQAEVFDSTIIKLISKTFHEGYDSTVFTYGQTGAGKSYTLVGNEADWNSSVVPPPSSVTTTSKHGNEASSPSSKFQTKTFRRKGSGRLFGGYQLKESDGIIPRVIDWIYTQLLHDEESEENYTIHISFLQIYDEKIYDLLNFDSSAHLRLRFAPTKEFYVENLFKAQAHTAEEAYLLLYNGLKNREVASHNMNLNSSRSHSIFTIEVHSKKDNFKAKCNLCDLAGSEKLSLLSSNPSAKLVKESITINKSLLALGKVITSLSQPGTGSGSVVAGPKRPQFIPYRDSKLTSLLRSALGGSSYCILIACIAPSDEYILENVSTLYYASRATNIQNRPVKRINPKDLMLQKLKDRIDQLEEENASLRSLVQKLTGSDIVDLESNDDDSPKATSGIVPNNAILLTESIISNGSAENAEKVSNIEIDNQYESDMDSHHSEIAKIQPKKDVKSSLLVRVPSVDPEIPVRAAGPSQEAFIQMQNVTMKLKEDNRMLGKKLVDSVKLLKHYMQTTNEMNRNLTEISDENNEYRFENETLNKENIQLREKIDILQSLFMSQENNCPQKRPSTASIYIRPQTASSNVSIPYPERVRTRDEEELLDSIRKRKGSIDLKGMSILEQAAFISNLPNAKSSVSSSQSNSRPSTRSSTRTPSRSRSKTPTSSYPNARRRSTSSSLYNKKGFIPFGHKYQQRLYKESSDE